MTEHLGRGVRQGSLSPHLFRRLLGLGAVGVGLLGAIAHQLGAAPVPYGLSLAIGGAGGLFLLTRDEADTALASPALSERWVVGLSLLSLVITNAVLALSFHVERRPTLVFFLLAAQAGLVAVQVFLAPCSSPQARFLLRCQVILLSIGIVLGRLLVFPEIGVDIWPQRFFAREIVTTGHFPPADTAYQGYPFWPALVGVISALTGRPEQDAVLALGVAFSAVALWLALVGLEDALGSRESLLAGLILAVSSWFAYWAALAVPMIVTVALFNAVLVLLFRRDKRIQLPLTACLLVVLAAGAFYHPMANVASSLLLLNAALALWASARRDLEGRRSLLSAQARRAAIGALVAVVLTVSVWMYLGDTFANLTLVVYHSLQQLEPLSFQGGYRTTVVYELDYLGFHLVLLLALARFMRWLVQAGRSPLALTLLGGSLVFLGINYVAVVTDAFFALPHRWLVYASALLAFPAALELWRIARVRQAGLALGGLLVMVLAFSAVVNTSINEDHPLYGAEVAFKQGLTASEAATLEFLDQHLVTHTAVDWQVWNYFRSLIDMELRPDRDLNQFIMYQETERGGICPDMPLTLPEAALVRRVYLNRRVGWTTCSVDLAGLAELDRARDFARVYDSGQASFYRRLGESGAASGSSD